MRAYLAESVQMGHGRHHAANRCDRHRLRLSRQSANMPIHKLMGSYRNQVPAYASSAILESKEAYVDEALSLKREADSLQNPSASLFKIRYRNL